VRPAQPHPDADRDTRRMPFQQLRALVVSLIEPDADPDAEVDAGPDTEIDDPVAEFDTMPTTCLPAPRTSTLDQLIASLPKAEPRMARGSTSAVPQEIAPSRSAPYSTRHAADTTRKIRGHAPTRGSQRR
jgi:hypothetical protein